jgi:RNA polymerase sigma-70 factor (family 1)
MMKTGMLSTAENKTKALETGSLIMDNEDIRLKELFGKDQQEAFRELFTQFYKPLVVAAKIYSGNSPESEDIVQQVFVKFWEEDLHKKINTSFRRYLHISVRNTCFNHLKQIKPTQQPGISADQEQLAEEALDFLLHREELQVFGEAYNELPPQSRKVFELVYFSDQSYKDAAQKLNLSINTVKSHLKNALRILKNSALLNSYFHERKKS